MYKFKFLLWALTKLLQRAARKDPAFARYIEGKALAFQIQTDDGIGPGAQAQLRHGSDPG